MPWIEQIQSANWNQAACISIFSYILGCFTAGYYLVRFARGQDVRNLGSGNVGARNVGRILGATGFFSTLLCDFAKGSLAVWAARHYVNDERLVALALLAVVIGHVWPLQLWFRGGKGIATSLGAVLVYDYHLAVAFVLFFLVAFAFLRKTVLPGLFAFVCLPLVSMYHAQDNVAVTTTSALAFLVLLTHRKNVMEEIHHLIEHRAVHPKPDQHKL